MNNIEDRLQAVERAIEDLKEISKRTVAVIADMNSVPAAMRPNPVHAAFHAKIREEYANPAGMLKTEPDAVTDLPDTLGMDPAGWQRRQGTDGDSP